MPIFPPYKWGHFAFSTMECLFLHSLAKSLLANSDCLFVCHTDRWEMSQSYFHFHWNNFCEFECIFIYLREILISFSLNYLCPLLIIFYLSFAFINSVSRSYLCIKEISVWLWYDMVWIYFFQFVICLLSLLITMCSTCIKQIVKTYLDKFINNFFFYQ